MTEKKELSGLARQILSGGGHVQLFTQQEFDEALALAKGEIMTVAIETSKRAVFIERQACADVVNNLADMEDEWRMQKIDNETPVKRTLGETVIE